jgi:hypothetical protein
MVTVCRDKFQTPKRGVEVVVCAAAELLVFRKSSKAASS